MCEGRKNVFCSWLTLETSPLFPQTVSLKLSLSRRKTHSPFDIMSSASGRWNAIRSVQQTRWALLFSTLQCYEIVSLSFDSFGDDYQIFFSFIFTFGPTFTGFESVLDLTALGWDSCLFCLSQHHHHHQLSLNREGRWGTTDDFATSFLHFFPCSPLPSETLRTSGLSIPWCCIPTSSSVYLVFFPLSLCLARWFWPDLMNGRHDHTTAVCVSYTGQKVLVWSDCLLDLVTDSPVGNMDFVGDA